MGNAAKIALVGVLALIVVVVAVWDKKNEEKHEDGLRSLPVTPLERPADPPRVKVTSAEPAAEDRVRGEMGPGLSVAGGALNPQGKMPRVMSGQMAAATPAATGTSTSTSTKPVETSPPAAKPEAKKTYTIAKSDTLSRIAEAQYGSKKHWKRIYDANRGVIRDPDNLPLGKEIVIPPDPAQTASAPQATTVKPSLSHTTEVTAVPASAAVPIGKGVAGAGYVYTVQRGDTLGKIAAKLLGGKDKWHLIYEANRDRLPTESSLKTGQQLVIPSSR